MKKEYFILLFVILITDCTFKNKGISVSKTMHISNNYPQEISNSATIDISNNYPKKEITLQNIAEIEYITLETTDVFLLSENCRISFISDKYIMIWENKGDIFIFHRSGKIFSHFNHKGLSNNEYLEISSIVFDETNEEVFVVDNFMASKYRVLVFSITGKYKRTLNYSEKFNLRAYNFDETSLLVYDEKGLLDNSYHKKPYMIMSKKDGSLVDTFDIELSVRLPYNVNGQISYNGQVVPYNYIIYPRYLAINNGQDIVISDISSDTIFILTKDRFLLPIITFSNYIPSSPLIRLYTNILTENFIVLEQRIFDFKAFDQYKGMPTLLLMYDFKLGLTSEVSFLNNDFPTDSWIPNRINISNKNAAASLIQLPKLFNAYRKNQLKGDLKKTVSNLNEEDNPIVMIVKFK